MSYREGIIIFPPIFLTCPSHIWKGKGYVQVATLDVLRAIVLHHAKNKPKELPSTEVLFIT